MDAIDLESWSFRVVELLQEICDDAQEASGNADGNDCCPDIRQLLEEHCKIVNGHPL